MHVNSTVQKCLPIARFFIFCKLFFQYRLPYAPFSVKMIPHCFIVRFRLWEGQWLTVLNCAFFLFFHFIRYAFTALPVCLESLFGWKNKAVDKMFSRCIARRNKIDLHFFYGQNFTNHDNTSPCRDVPSFYIVTLGFPCWCKLLFL